MMMKIWLVPLFVAFGLAGCNSEEIDDQKPVIDLDIADAFPVNCDTLYLGVPFTWTVRFTDNRELGSYSLEIHNNFDHHAHSTEIESCDLDPIKDPVNPFHTIMDFSIAPGTGETTISQEITLPLSDSHGEFDEGDYHFFISLTDREGWSTQKGLSIKILKKE